MIMDYKKRAGFLVIIFSVLLLGLQGCRTAVMKQNPVASLSKSAPKSAKTPQLSDAETLKLFQKGSYVNLVEMGRGYKKDYVNGKLVDKPLELKLSSNPSLRQTIISTPRGKALSVCQFRALRIEVDGKKSTADWLVTTKGKGARCSGDTQFFWVIQQGDDTSTPALILLQGRASWVSIEKPKNKALSEVSVGNHGYIKIKYADTLSDGSYVQVNSSDKGRVEISCRSKLHLQGKHYKFYKESVEAYVESALAPGKTWQPVDDPRYRCPF